MAYWLLKSEPDCFGIDHLIKAKQQTSSWDGVRNYQARNFMRDEMKKGDKAFFYHSNVKKMGIVGVVEIVKESYPDFTAFDPENEHYDPKSNPDNPRWFMVDVQFKKKLKRTIELQELKKNPALDGMQLLQRANRLSITPVTKQQWDAILKME